MDDYSICIITNADGCSETFLQQLQKQLLRRGVEVFNYHSPLKNIRITHGTVCAGIISQYTKADIIIDSLKVKPPEGRGNIYSLGQALEYCIDKRINMANISVGSTNPSDEAILAPIVKRALDNNITIVAAISNDQQPTFPAMIPGVIAVKDTPKGVLGLYYYKDSNVTIGASSAGLRLISNESTVFAVAQSNSFATAYVTAKIATYINENKWTNTDEIIRNMKLKCFNNDCIWRR